MKNKLFLKLYALVCCVGMCLFLQYRVVFALDLSVNFATKDKDNQESIQQQDVLYAKEETEKKIRKKISDTKLIEVLHLCIEAKDYKTITIKSSLTPQFTEVIDTQKELTKEGLFYFKIFQNAVYTIVANDGQETKTIEVPVTIIGMLGERDTEKPIILSLDYKEGNFVLDTIDFKPGLYGIFEDNDSMNQILDLSKFGNKAKVTHKKESGGYWIRIYDKDDNYRECKLTGLEPRVKSCYKKDTKVKLKVLDSIGLWKITEKPDGKTIKNLSGKESEVTINISSKDVPCIYVYNHANNYKKIELEEYLDEPEVTKAVKSGKNVALVAKDPVGLSKITETVDGDSILKLMGKNVTVRFNLSNEDVEDIYVYDEFNNIAKIHLDVDEEGPDVSVKKEGNDYVVYASDEESGIWKITEASTDKILKNYMKDKYPAFVTETLDGLNENEEYSIKVYDYVGNSTLVKVKDVQEEVIEEPKEEVIEEGTEKTTEEPKEEAIEEGTEKTTEEPKEEVIEENANV